MDKNNTKVAAKIIVANAEAKLSKIKNTKVPPTTEIKLDTKRKLTSGEINLCRKVFQDSIDYSKVYVQMGGLIGVVTTLTGNAMTPAGNINLPNDDYKNNKDFSKSRPMLQHWFMHEMVHVWQFQLGANTAKFGAKQFICGGYTTEVKSVDSGEGELKAYDTDITARDNLKKFNEFNFEQQARIIEFYFDGMFLQNDEPNRKHHQKSLKLQGHVMKILTDFLINPKDKKLLPKG